MQHFKFENLTIGGFDLEAYSSANNFTYYPVMDDADHWALHVTEIKVDRHSMGTVSTLALIDSSSGVAKGPSD